MDFLIQGSLVMAGGGGILHAAIRGSSGGIFWDQSSGDDQATWMGGNTGECGLAALSRLSAHRGVGHDSSFSELINELTRDRKSVV